MDAEVMLRGGERGTAASALPRSFPWIDRLLRHDTTSRGSNLALIEDVRDALHSHGLHPWLTHEVGGTKANLFVTVPAADGRTAGGTVLSGHTDVVPVDGQDWSSDPFIPEVRDGLLFARGAADMKSFLGIALAHVPDMLAAPLREPIHLALSFDEEVGCLGAPLMLAEVEARGLSPRGCIIGEPTSMEVVMGHKGINIYRCRVRGRSAHSSLPENGVNAIEYAARLICFIRDLADDFRRDGPFDHAFDAPYVTAQTGLISGGAASNLIPELCTFEFEFRNLPTVEAAGLLGRIETYARDTLLPKMRGESDETGIEFDRIAQAPAMEASEDAAITGLVRALARDHGTRKVAYGTEGGQFEAIGIPTVICGPGDIRQAHRPDEFVSLEQIRRCEAFVGDFIAGKRV